MVCEDGTKQQTRCFHSVKRYDTLNCIICILCIIWIVRWFII